MPSAIAAEVLVLPTPPDPAHTQIRLPASISATLTAAAPVRRPAPRSARPRGDRADASDLGEGPRSPEQPDAVAGRRGIADHEVVRNRALGAALCLGELPDLADRRSSRIPGVAIVKAWNRRLEPSM